VGLVTGVLAAVLAVAGLILWDYHHFNRRVSQSELWTPLNQFPELRFPSMDQTASGIRPDPNWAFKDLDGKEHRLSDFRGQAVFLDFWATWCNGCVAELPFIKHLEQEMNGSRVAFILVSAEDASKVRAFRPFAGSASLGHSVYVSSEKPPAELATYGIPTTYILSPTGELVFRRVGEARWDDKNCVEFLRQLAGTPETRRAAARH